MALMALIMLIVSSITFFIIRWLPGDPVFLLVGDHPTKEQIEQARKDFGFDDPVYKQYASFLKKIMVLDFGVSLRTRQPIITEITNRFSATFELVLFSMFIAVILGYLMGIISALRQRTILDYLVRGFGYIGLSVPVFWLGMIMQLIFFGILFLFPLQGRYSGIGSLNSQLINYSGFLLIDSILSFEWDLFTDALNHMILPSLTMAFGVLGIMLRTTRTSTIEIMNTLFFRTFRSFGFNDYETILKSGYKNTLIPVTTVAGLSFGLMLGGTFLIESIFDWPGLGQFSVLSILTRDFPAILGVTIIYSSTYVIINFLIDVFYALIDPRIRGQN